MCEKHGIKDYGARIKGEKQDSQEKKRTLNNLPSPTSPRVVVGLKLLHGVKEGIKGRGR